MAREHALHAAMGVEHREILLTAREQQFDPIPQCGLGWQGTKIGQHGITHAQIPRGFLLGDAGGLLPCGHEDEEADEQDHGLKRVVQQHEDGHHHRDALANGSRPPCRGTVFHEHGKDGAQHAATVHGKGGDQVEGDHEDIPHHELFEEAA